MAATRRQFTREFKLEVVRLVTESGKSHAQVARELGIRPDMLRTWKRQAAGRPSVAATDVFPGKGHQPSPDEDMQRLRRENERLRQERDFLQKAAAYFAKESRQARLAELRAAGVPGSAAARQVAKDLGVPRSEVYALWVAMQDAG